MTVLSFIAPNQWGLGRGVSNLALVVIPAKAGQKIAWSNFRTAAGWPEGRDTWMYPVIQAFQAQTPRAFSSLMVQAGTQV